jgi:hypothetical protein
MTEEMSEESRVVYVGGGRESRKNALGLVGFTEPETEWRKRQAQDLEVACHEMARLGLRLTQVVPVLSTTANAGSWTEGAWLFFDTAE